MVNPCVYRSGYQRAWLPGVYQAGMGRKGNKLATFSYMNEELLWRLLREPVNAGVIAHKAANLNMIVNAPVRLELLENTHVVNICVCSS